MKLARAIRREMLNPTIDNTKKPRFYDIWGDTPEQTPSIMHISAPKMPLPGNELSYNPPSEYLKTPDEIAEQQLQSDTPIFIPQKFDSLRKVPLYDHFIQDRYISSYYHCFKTTLLDLSAVWTCIYAQE